MADPRDVEIARLRDFAHEATKVLVGLTAGGSEYFAGQVGGIYLADLERCVTNIQHRRERDMRMVGQEREMRMKAEAERDAALAQVAGAYEAAAKICDGSAKYHMSDPDDIEAMMETAKEIRALTPTDALAARDAAIAGAYEAVRDRLQAVHQKLFSAAEAGDESPEFLGTVASGLTMAMEAVHDLTPADALAAHQKRRAVP